MQQAAYCLNRNLQHYRIFKMINIVKMKDNQMKQKAARRKAQDAKYKQQAHPYILYPINHLLLIINHYFCLAFTSLFSRVLHFSLTNRKIYAVAAKFISGRNFFICGCSEIYIRKKFFYMRLQRNLYQEEIFLYAVAAKFISGENFRLSYSTKFI
jgi:hypothetical protein